MGVTIERKRIAPGQAFVVTGIGVVATVVLLLVGGYLGMQVRGGAFLPKFDSAAPSLPTAPPVELAASAATPARALAACSLARNTTRDVVNGLLTGAAATDELRRQAAAMRTLGAGTQSGWRSPADGATGIAQAGVALDELATNAASESDARTLSLATLATACRQIGKAAQPN